MAVGLARLGVGRNDVVAMQLPNWWQFLALHLHELLTYLNNRGILTLLVLAQMGLNVLINAFFQGIPVVGDMCTFFFKANRRNYALLRRYAGTGKPVTRGDWIFVLGVLAATFAIAVALSTFLVWLIISQFRPFG